MALGDGTKRKHAICTGFPASFFFNKALAFLSLTLSVFTISFQTTVTDTLCLLVQKYPFLVYTHKKKNLLRPAVKAIILNVDMDEILFENPNQIPCFLN